MAELKRLLLWGGVMTVMILAVFGVGLYLVYQSAYRDQGEILMDLAESQAKLITAVARFDRDHSPDYQGEVSGLISGSAAATLGQIRDAFSRDRGLGQTGELVLGMRDGDDIVILLHHREALTHGSDRIPVDSSTAEAMRIALSGRQDVVEALDLHDNRVLAATYPLPELGWALVAKRDLAEIRAPYLQAASLTAIIALLLTMLGSVAFRRVTGRTIDGLRRSEARYDKMIRNAAEGVLAVDEHGRVTLINQRTRDILGLDDADLYGHPLVDVLPPDLAKIAGDDLAILRRGREEFFEHDIYVDGVEKFLDVSAVALRGAHGKYEGAMAMIMDVTERRRTHMALEHDRKLLHSVLHALPVGVWAVDEQGRFFLHNLAGDAMTGLNDYSGGRALMLEFKGWDLESGRQLRTEEWGLIRALDYGETVQDQLIDLKAFDGETRLLRYSAVPFWGEGGKRIGAIAVAEDISDQRQAELEMRKLSDALRQTADAVVLMGVEGNIEYANPAFERITGYAREECIGHTPTELLKTEGSHDDYLDRVWQALRQGKAHREITLNRNKKGKLFNWDVTLSPIVDQKGNVVSIVGTATDLTKQGKIRDELYRATRFDMLTGLGLRSHLLDLLTQSLSGLHYRPRVTGLVLMDINHFTSINESMGHEAGDAILVECARRLEASVREGDHVARIGADSFAVLLQDVATEEDVTQVVNKLRDVMAEPVDMEGRPLYLTLGVGVALAPRDGDRADVVFRHAEAALAEARSGLGDHLVFYDVSLGEAYRKRVELEAALREAITQASFFLHFQPQISLITGELRGLEALIRWEHPEWGPVSPAEFIPLAEQCGMAAQISTLVLHKALEQYSHWKSAGYTVPPISVNISAAEFGEGDLVKRVREALDEHGLPGEVLELELTETAFAGNTARLKETLERIKSMGVSVSVDDFGTGYSSLSYLSQLPIDALKVDRAFVSALGDEGCREESVVRAILSLGHSLGCEVIAEGVETQWQLDFLRKLGCDVIQGFLLARPLQPDDVEDWLGQGAMVFKNFR